MEIKAPTCKEIFDEIDGLEFVTQDAARPWRWGVVRTDIYKRFSDQTYWRVIYRVSTDGETNELREGEADVVQVEPKEVTRTEYVPIERKEIA